jgi:hypothetical protein
MDKVLNKRRDEHNKMEAYPEMDDSRISAPSN